MAQVLIDADHITVRLRGWERWAALRGDVTVPRTAVRGVSVVDRPFDHLRGLRLPGTCVPRRLAIGTWRAKGVHDLVAVAARQPAVLVALDRALADGWTRLLVSVDDPNAIRRALEPPEPPEAPAPRGAAQAARRRVRPLTASRS